jgi:two-component system sensor histidine kinase RpfC
MAYLLVAEDNPVERMVLRAILSREQHQVFLAEDGDLALELLGQLAVDLAIIDLQLPGVDGIEVLRRYRASDNVYADCTPFLAISADDSSELERRVLEAGASAWLPKPLSPELLLVAVARLIDERHCHLSSPRRLPPRESARTLDVQILETLASSVSDPGFVPALIERFQFDCNRNLAALREAFENSEYLLFREGAHALQGAAGSVGAERLAVLARELRNQDDSVLLADGRQHLVALEEEFACLRRCFDALPRSFRG